MGKSATEIEADIRSALRVCSLEAKGLWCVMRYVIEESDRPGHLRQNGRPMSELQLAREAGCDSSTVTRLQQELEEAGLLTRSERTWHSPFLARLSAKRSAGAARVRRFREKTESPQSPEQVQGDEGALRNTPCNADVTPHVTPDPPNGFSSPLTPISSLPPPVRARGAESGGSGSTAHPPKPPSDAEILSEARRFAVNWLTVHDPGNLRKHQRGFTELIVRLAQSRSIDEAKKLAIEEGRAHADKSCPHAYALSLYDDHGRKTSRVNGTKPATRPTRILQHAELDEPQ